MRRPKMYEVQEARVTLSYGSGNSPVTKVFDRFVERPFGVNTILAEDVLYIGTRYVGWRSGGERVYLPNGNVRSIAIDPGTSERGEG